MGYASPLKRVFLPSINLIVQAHNVDCQQYTPPIQRAGEAWMFDYDNLWKCFKLSEDLSDEDYNVLYQHLNESNSSFPVPEESEPIVYFSFSDDEIEPNSIPNDDQVFNDAVASDDQMPIYDDPIYDQDEENPEIIEELSPSSSAVNNEGDFSNLQPDVTVPLSVTPRTLSYHSEENIIGDLYPGVQTRSQINNDIIAFYVKTTDIRDRFTHQCYISQIEPKTYKEALTEESWVNAMQEELHQFEKLGVWKLVDLPDNQRCINTKWVFKCKRDDQGVIVRNKARLVVLGYNQREGIDYT